MPVSLFDRHFNSFQNEILPIANAQGVGVIGMKSLAAGHLLEDPSLTLSPVDAIRYSLSQPISALCVGTDSMKVLQQNLGIGQNFVPMTLEEQTAAIEAVYHLGWNGQKEPFKTSYDYEGNEARREHGLPLRTAAD
jgi:predicted aldo/keto reductase-like oxidoreductase